MESNQAPELSQPKSSQSELSHVDHVAIAVTNVAQAVDWWCKAFNCQVTYQDETWAVLEFANIKIALVIPEQHPAHLAFSRKDAERFGQLTEHRDGSKSVYIEDPFGNSIEILEK